MSFRASLAQSDPQAAEGRAEYVRAKASGFLVYMASASTEVEKMCAAPPDTDHTCASAFGRYWRGYTFMPEVRPLRDAHLPYEVDRSNPNAMQEAMIRFHRMGYVGTSYDVRTRYENYARLLRLLGVPTNIPAVCMFHGSSVPPEVILNDGIDTHTYGRPEAFSGKRFYCAHPARAAQFAKPYLYLFLMLVDPPPPETRRSISENDRTSEIIIARFNPAGGVLADSELAILQQEGVSLRSRGILPIACFYSQPYLVAGSTGMPEFWDAPSIAVDPERFQHYVSYTPLEKEERKRIVDGDGRLAVDSWHARARRRREEEEGLP